MKKTLFICCAIVICLVVFIIAPYLLLKSSILTDCEHTTIQCEKIVTTNIPNLNLR